MTVVKTTKNRIPHPVRPHAGGDTGWSAEYASAYTFIDDKTLPAFYVEAQDGADDKAKASAAITAAKVSGRAAKVVFGPKAYALADLAITFPQDANKALVLEGQGGRSTRLNFTTDRGLGTYALAGESTGGTCYGAIRKMMIVGPNQSGTVTLGTAPANMNGIRHQGGMVLEDLYVAGFRSGVVNTSDHCKMYRCEVRNCYYSVLFDDQTTVGDHEFYSCEFSFNAMANVAVAADSYLVDSLFSKCHFGWTPYVFYIEAGAPAETLNVDNLTLLDCHMEGAGNGFFHAAGKTSNFGGLRLIGEGSYSVNPTYKLPASPAFVGVWANRVSEWVLIGPGPTSWDCNYIGPVKWLSYLWKSSLAAAIAAGGTLFKALVTGLGGIGLEDGSNRSAAYALEAGQSVTKGQLVAFSPSTINPATVRGYSRTMAGGGGIIAGVALHDASAASNQLVCVAQLDTDGNVVVQNVGTGYAVGDVLVPDDTTAGKVTRVPASGSKPIGKPVIGRVNAGDGASGTVQAVIGISQAGTFTRPTLNAAATDAATTQALVNQLRQMAIDAGLAV